MKRRILIITGIGAGVLLTLGVAILAGGYLLNALTHGALPVFAAQDFEPNPEAGLIVTSVVKDCPAEKAGIVRGDILLGIYDEEVNNMRDVFEILAEVELGDDVRLTILHGDDLSTFTIPIEKDHFREKLGLSLCCGASPEKDIVVFEPEKGKPLIIHVMEDSPADEAGLKVGDLILEINGKELDEEDDLAEWIREYKPGDQIELEIERLDDDGRITLSVELGEHPEKDGVPYLGVHFIKAPEILSLPLGEGKLEEFEFNFKPFGDDEMPFRHWFREELDGRIRPFLDGWFISPFQEDLLAGILISEIIDASPASEAGLEEGDLIVSFDGEEIDDPEQFVEMIASKKPGEKVLLTLYRDDLDDPLEIRVILGEHPDKEGTGYLGIKIKGWITINHSNDKSLFDRRFPRFDFDRFEFPFEFDWQFNLPGSKET
jgi:S1-C subfamily serine protease